MPVFGLTLVSATWLLYAAAAVVLAVVILRSGARKWQNIALAAFLLQQAIATVLSVVVFTVANPTVIQAAFRLIVPVWLLWGPIVFLCGPLLLAGSASKLAWGVGILGSLPGAGLALVGIVDPNVILDPVRIEMTRIAAQGFFLVFLGFAVTVAFLAREALTTELPTRRAQFGLLAAAFTVEGAYHAVGNTAKLALGFDYHGISDAGALLTGITVAPVVVYGALAVALVTVAVRTDDAARRSWAIRILGFLTAASGTGVIASGIQVSGQMQEPVGLFHALWDLAAIALITYAGLQFELFGIERHAKRSVAVSVAIVGGFLTFLVAQEIVEGLVAEGTVLGQLPWADVLAALAVGVAVIPLQKIGRRVAAEAFPEVVGARSYEADRRTEVYRAAVEGALADGITDPEEAASVRRLQETLGISESLHDEIVEEVRAILEGADADPDDAGSVSP